MHTPQMHRDSLAIKENAEYRYDKLGGFRAFIVDFFKNVNVNKGLSRDVDIDEILKKASSKRRISKQNYFTSSRILR